MRSRHRDFIAVSAWLLTLLVALLPDAAWSQQPIPGTYAQGFLQSDGDPYAMVPQANTSIVPTGLFGTGIGDGRLFGRPVFNGGWQPGAAFGAPGWERPRLFPWLQNRVYFGAEYLIWDLDGMRIPALVTTSPAGTPSDIAGVLGESGTSVVFGGGSLNGGSTSGVRLTGGISLTPSQRSALEFEYFNLNGTDDGYNAFSDGAPILARPFFDAAAGQETSQLIAFPGRVNGGINIASSSDLDSFMFGARFALCPAPSTCCPQCGQPDGSSFLIGYRGLNLDDSISIREDLTSTISNIPGTLTLVDRFETRNEFDGLQLGLMHRKTMPRAWLESSLRVAFGNNNKSLSISGSNRATESGVSVDSAGGLYAQRTNSGFFEKDDFMLVPEAGLKLGFQVTRSLNATIGYTVLYFPNVVRASEQIDTDLNPGLFDPEDDPLTGPLRPRVLWVETDYLAHGLTLGGEFRF